MDFESPAWSQAVLQRLDVVSSRRPSSDDQGLGHLSPGAAPSTGGRPCGLPKPGLLQRLALMLGAFFSMSHPLAQSSMPYRVSASLRNICLSHLRSEEKRAKTDSTLSKQHENCFLKVLRTEHVLPGTCLLRGINVSYALFLRTSPVRSLHAETAVQRPRVPLFYLFTWMRLSNGRDCFQFNHLVVWGLGRGRATASQPRNTGRAFLCPGAGGRGAS